MPRCHLAVVAEGPSLHSVSGPKDKPAPWFQRAVTLVSRQPRASSAKIAPSLAFESHTSFDDQILDQDAFGITVERSPARRRAQPVDQSDHRSM